MYTRKRENKTKWTALSSNVLIITLNINGACITKSKIGRVD